MNILQKNGYCIESSEVETGLTKFYCSKNNKRYFVTIKEK